MCEFHYDYIKNKCNNKSKMLFTKTDNLVHEIEIEKVYGDFSKNKEIFDHSNYSAKSMLLRQLTCISCGCVAVEEFVRLKPKAYSILMSNSSEHKKQKVKVKIFLLKQVTMKMFCWIKNAEDM